MMSSQEGMDNFKEQFEGMMGAMISKEALYGPMKGMKDEFPKFLEENADKITIEDLERYNNQLDVLEELIKRFDDAGDEKVPSEEIIEYLNKLQAHGAPPPELLQKLGLGMPGMGMPGMGMPGMGMPGMGMPGMGLPGMPGMPPMGGPPGPPAPPP